MVHKMSENKSFLNFHELSRPWVCSRLVTLPQTSWNNGGRQRVKGMCWKYLWRGTQCWEQICRQGLLRSCSFVAVISCAPCARFIIEGAGSREVRAVWCGAVPIESTVELIQPISQGGIHTSLRYRLAVGHGLQAVPHKSKVAWLKLRRVCT